MDKDFRNDSIFFEGELEAILPRTFEVDFPGLRAREFIPVNGNLPEGAESWKYEQYEGLGVAKLLANYGDDSPRVDVRGTEHIKPFRTVAASFGYNVQEVRAARMAGKPLEQRRANSAREAIEREIDRVLALGDAAAGLPGFLNDSNISAVDATADGTGSSPLWEDKTPDLILRDLNQMVEAIVGNTNAVEMPTDLLLPPTEYTRIAQLRLTDENTTVLDFFVRTNPFIQRVNHWWRLENAGEGSNALGRAVCYTRSPDKLEGMIPMEFMAMPVERRGREFVVETEARVGGTAIYKPAGVYYLDDFGGDAP